MPHNSWSSPCGTSRSSRGSGTKATCRSNDVGCKHFVGCPVFIIEHEIMITFCLESNRLHDTLLPLSWLDFNLGNYIQLPKFRLSIYGSVSLLAPIKTVLARKDCGIPYRNWLPFPGMWSNVPLLNGIIPVRSVHRWWRAVWYSNMLYNTNLFVTLKLCLNTRN